MNIYNVLIIILIMVIFLIFYHEYLKFVDLLSENKLNVNKINEDKKDCALKIFLFVISWIGAILTLLCSIIALKYSYLGFNILLFIACVLLLETFAWKKLINKNKKNNEKK